MQEVLIDRRQLILENDIEQAERLGIARNAGMRFGTRRYSAARSWGRAAAPSIIFSIVSWHRPQFFLTLQ
ncbi:MAG: hypothetical protein WDM86_22855 [Rhizomicrobium sp.]